MDEEITIIIPTAKDFPAAVGITYDGPSISILVEMRPSYEHLLREERKKETGRPWERVHEDVDGQ